MNKLLNNPLRHRPPSALLPLALGAALVAGPACKDEPVAKGESQAELGPAPSVTPAEPQLRRLTTVQYGNTVRALFGDDIVVPQGLEPDTAVDGLFSEGATAASLSASGVADYEDAAFNLAEQVMASETRRATLVTCSPVDVVDPDCARDTLRALGRRAWRRPLSEEELDSLSLVSTTAAAVLDDFYAGLEFGVAGLLQSPYFIYRVELGEDDGAGGRVYTSVEMASRLSYFLWNTMPDDELLDAAEAGELSTDAGIAVQADRLLADPRVREGVATLFDEMLALHSLPNIDKDPTVFTRFTDSLGAAGREETRLGIEALIFEEQGSYLDLFTTRRTFVNRELAALYNVAAPSRDGFGEVELPADGGRAGLLGQVGFLALNAHPTSTSATVRGKSMREQLLCQTVLPPPADLNASLPEVSEAGPTMRDRLSVHATDPACATCHNLMDPIGLGLENFDGLGSWRLTENDTVIDPSGELDGEPFADAIGLGQRLAESPRVPYCLTETMYRYAEGHPLAEGEEAMVNWLNEAFVMEEHRVEPLLRALVTSPGFRTAGALEAVGG